MLWLDPNSQVILGNNAKIHFKNGARIRAHNSSFVSYNPSSSYWQGLYFENPRGSGLANDILNCTFSNAVNSINIQNDQQNASYNNQIVNNIFNISASNGIGIYAKNIFKIICTDNTFNINSSNGTGIKVENYYNTESFGGAGTYSLNFINNTFNNGVLQMAFYSYPAYLTPVYVYRNHFNNCAGVCFAGRMITDVIKQNTFSSSYAGNMINIWQSNINLLDNIFTSSGSTIMLNNSYPGMAPVPSVDSWNWLGGRNYLTAQYGNNITITAGYPITDYGQNSFTLNHNGYYHLFGTLPDSVASYYYCRDNCWYGPGGRITYLYNNHINPIPLLWQSNHNIDCYLDLNPTGWQIVDKGNDIYDTIFTTAMESGDSSTIDAALYSQSIEYINASNYFEGITDLKMLIDNYTTSSYIYTSLYDLYHCYEMLDTSDNQNTRDIMFSNLKNYLNDKIQQYCGDAQFVDIAYNLTLSCDTKMQNYNSAASGYEFIALYHPNEEIQLFASIDYTYIEELLNGGGSNSDITKAFNLKKFLDKKPVHKIVKESYEKVAENNLMQANTITQKYSRTDKRELIERAKYNINTSIGLAREEKERRRTEDLKLLLGLDKISNSKADNITPLKFSLSQNYPNPFNPVTKIKYELPKNVNVTIKIYDLLGREVTILVNNEFKLAGSYEIEWNASNYASGVYFYRIQAGDFTDVKKMVLIK